MDSNEQAARCSESRNSERSSVRLAHILIGPRINPAHNHAHYFVSIWNLEGQKVSLGRGQSINTTSHGGTQTAHQKPIWSIRGFGVLLLAQSRGQA
jgi:hypothetical protein